MKIKLLFFLPVLMVIINCAVAQHKIMKYCQVRTYDGGFSGKKFIVVISTGKVDSLFKLKDTTYKKQLQKITTLTTNTDVLNYMALKSWTLCQSNWVGDGRDMFIFIFKREFDESELSN